MRGLVLACLVLSVLAIYKDEAGKYDWALTHVGQVVFADLILVKDRSRLVVQSSRGVLATLKMSGQVDWRKLPYGLDAHFQVMSTPGYVVTFEPKQEVLSAWDPEDGMLLWSQQVSGAKDVVLKQSLVSTHICVLLGETLLVINLGSGKVIHKIALGDGFTHIIRMEKLDILVVAKADPVFAFLSVNVEKGTADAIVHGKLQNPNLHITYSGLVATKGNRTEWLASMRLEAGDWPHETIKHVSSLSDVLIDATGKAISSTSLKVIGHFSKLGIVAESPESSPLLMLNNSTLITMSLDTGIRKTSEIAFNDASFSAEQLWAFRGTKGMDLLLCRGKDYALVLIDQGKVKWRREEALGHAENAIFVDLPGESLHAHNEYFIALTERKGLAALPGLFLTRVATQIQTILTRYHSEPKANLSMDNFGFNKLLLVTTTVGKVFAVHSMTGETVWTRDIPACLVQHFASIDIEQVALITQCGDSSQLLVLSVVSGETVAERELKGRILRVIDVEKEDYKVLVIVAKDLSVTLFPSDEVSKLIVSQQKLGFYVVNKEEGTVLGYHITSNLTCSLGWNLLLPSAEHITAFKAVSHGRIQQPAIATGLSKLLYKYIDTNLFILATMKTKAGAKDSELAVYLVNGVSGRVLSKIRQDGVSGRVAVDCDENWAVVHYWSSRSGRYEFLSIELFEHKIGDSAWEMIRNYLENANSETISAYTRPAPVVLHQSYATTTGFQAIDHTVTLQGITRQDLLLIMNSGQVLALDRRQLSPRRKPEEDLTPSDFDDALLPIYKPLVPLVHTNILTHDRNVEGLQRTAVAWALLESTCFVAAYGLDLFVARVMPEKSFDMLTDDFNYSAIVISLGVLVAATVVAEIYFKKNQVKRLFSS